MSELHETLGAKLRRLARNAERNNPIERPPLLRPPAWAPSTAYTQGQVVSNSGRWYVCVTTGTSAASGGPTTSVTGDALSDGTAAWTLYGAAELAADDALAPAYSFTTTNPFGSGATQAWETALFPNNFRLYGGQPTVGAGNSWAPRVFADSASTYALGHGCSIGFVTDDPYVAVLYLSNTPGLGVVIDGRFCNIGQNAITAGGGWLIFDWTALGGRKERSYRVYGGMSASGLRGAQLNSAASIWAPPTIDDVRAVFIGDSIWAGSGYGPMLSGRMLPNIVAMMLGWSDPWNFSTGGTGLLATNGGSYYTYRQRIAEALTRNPDMWLIGASRNDLAQTAAAIIAEAVLTLQTIRAGSTAPIIVTGVVMSKTSGEAASLTALENAWAAAVTQFADPLGKTFFIPAHTDAMPWMTGAWTDTLKASLGNTGLYLGGDSIHPVDAGTHYLAKRIVRGIKAQVLPNLL